MEMVFFKKNFSHGDLYKSLVLTIRSIKYIKMNREKKLVSSQFQERIMLAVTEVNGCEVCSYAHTKIALEEGMDPEEISSILIGNLENSPKEEAVGIFFAQHYSDNNRKTTKEAWERLVQEYGQDKSMVILAYTRMITSGNIYGMAISSIRARLKGKPSGKTNLLYELSIIISIALYLPAAALQALFDNLRNKSIYPYVEE